MQNFTVQRLAVALIPANGSPIVCRAQGKRVHALRPIKRHQLQTEYIHALVLCGFNCGYNEMHSLKHVREASQDIVPSCLQLKMTAFWVVASCSLEDVYRR
jgi:hypothetical protein